MVGYVKQEPYSILNPWFAIQNTDRETVLHIKGPMLGCSCKSGANFVVVSSDMTQKVGKISKQWTEVNKELFAGAEILGIQCKASILANYSCHNCSCYIVPLDLDVKTKAVMVGACFLIVSNTDMVYL